MKITHIARGKKSKRINIFVDDEFAFSVEETTLVKNNLYKGREITQEEIDQIVSNDLIVRFTFRVIELLGRRPRSISEIRQYLRTKLINPVYGISKERISEISESIISKLQKDNYLNDYEFAQWWVKGRQEHRPRGKAMIKNELFKKGIDKEIITEVLDELIDADSQFDAALKAGEQKYNRLRIRETDKFKIKSKLSAFLFSKGYDWDTIGKVMKEIL